MVLFQGRQTWNAAYHDPHPKALHTHPHHRDPEYDNNAHAAALGTLWVITAVSNPVRYKTRYALYRKFKEHVTRELGLHLITVEAAFGDRDFQLTDDDITDAVVQTTLDNGVKTIDVRVTTRSMVWLKENLWNVGVRHLPRDCRYVLCADADIQFLNPHFATELVHALQEYKVVQPFVTAADMGPEGQIIDVHRSFGWCYAEGWPWKPQPDGQGGYCAKKPSHLGKHEAFGNAWHPGYAIAVRRSVLDKLPFLETGVLGAGDHHMMGALIGRAHLTMPSKVHEAYRRQVLDWQSRALDVVNKQLGFVHGTILHHFHGAKANRRYVSRWDILVQHKYDPDRDVYKNSYGVLELEDRNPELRDAIKRYFKQRHEDGIDV